MLRMQCLCARIALLASMLGCAAAMAMWVRSVRALDEWSGRIAGVSFDIDSFAGQVEIHVSKFYRSRAGAVTGPGLLDQPRPFDSLEFDQVKGSGFNSRQRWPLGDTDRWEPSTSFFPKPSFKSALTWARQGPGRFVFVRWIEIPYWLQFFAFAAPPAMALARFRRRAGNEKANGFPVIGNAAS